MKEIPLTQGKVAQVDDEDFEWLNQWRWCFHGDGYAERRSARISGKSHIIFMHRLIAKTPDGFETDHIDGDGLNNQRHNLRICSNAENQHNRGVQTNNTSGYKGVVWDRQRQRWLASIRINQRLLFLGRFETAEDAAQAYDEKAKILFGGFARTNFPS